MAFKSFEKTLEENNSLLSFLNTYTEYFINGILQHCKHIVRLNVHVCVCVCLGHCEGSTLPVARLTLA